MEIYRATVRTTCYGVISKGAVTVCLGYTSSGYSTLLLVIPGVELGAVKTYKLGKPIPEEDANEWM